MTSYLVRHDQTGSYSDVAVAVGTYAVRLVAVSFWSYTGGGITFQMFRYDVGTMSGGKAVNVVTLRQGATAASATARIGNLTFTGGPGKQCGATYVGPGAVSTSAGTSTITAYPGATGSLQFPLTTVCAPGSVFTINGFHNTLTGCEVYFEELRLAGSY